MLLRVLGGKVRSSAPAHTEMTRSKTVRQGLFSFLLYLASIVDKRMDSGVRLPEFKCRLHFVSCMTLGKLLKLSVPQLTQL